MDKTKVYEIIKEENKPYGFDPVLLLAIVEQESDFDETSSRMENKFKERYLKHLQTLSTTSAILLSTSYGLMQTLGESLLEDGYMEFFQDWYNEKYDVIRTGGIPLRGRSQIGVVKAIDEYMIHQDWQIRFGIKHFKLKYDLAHADQNKTLLFWNGGGNPNYPIEVMAKYENLKGSALFS